MGKGKTRNYLNVESETAYKRSWRTILQLIYKQTNRPDLHESVRCAFLCNTGKRCVLANKYSKNGIWSVLSQSI